MEKCELVCSYVFIDRMFTQIVAVADLNTCCMFLKCCWIFTRVRELWAGVKFGDVCSTNGKCGSAVGYAIAWLCCTSTMKTNMNSGCIWSVTWRTPLFSSVGEDKALLFGGQDFVLTWPLASGLQLMAVRHESAGRNELKRSKRSVTSVAHVLQSQIRAMFYHDGTPSRLVTHSWFYFRCDPSHFSKWLLIVARSFLHAVI